MNNKTFVIEFFEKPYRVNTQEIEVESEALASKLAWFLEENGCEATVVLPETP